MKKPILLLLIAASMLTGCASGEMPMPTVKLLPPASLLAQCPATLPQPESPRLPDLLRNHVQSAEIYHLCRESHNGLVEWLEVTSD